MRAKARMLRLEIDNELAHIWWEAMTFLSRWGRLFVKQAHHTLPIKLICLVVQRAFTGCGFFGTLSRRLSKEHDGAQQFIDLLLRPQGILLNLLPVMGRFSTFATAMRHGVSLVKHN